MPNDPRRLGPPSLIVTQFPSRDRTPALADQGLEMRKLDTASFPLAASASGATDGDVLVFIGSTGLWTNQNWVPGPFGVGIAAVSTRQLTVQSTDPTRYALVVKAANRQTQQVFQVRKFNDDLTFTVNASGQAAIGTLPQQDQTFAVSGGAYCVYTSSKARAKSGATGLILRKRGSYAFPTTLEFEVFIPASGAVSTWGLGQDYDTDDQNPYADLILAYDYTADKGAGADILRCSAAITNPWGVTLWTLTNRSGTARNFNDLLTMRPGAFGLGGLNIGVSGGAALTLILDSTAPVYDRTQTALTAGYSSINGPNNRSVNIQQLLDASTVRNYLFMSGCASGGTAASPQVFSSFAKVFGFESTDSAMSWITGANGAPVTPIRALSLSSLGNLTAASGLLVGGPLTVNGPGVVGETLNVTGIGTFATRLTAAGSIGTGISVPLGQFHAKTANAGTIVGIFQGAVGQTGSLLEAWNFGNTPQFSVSATGDVLVKGVLTHQGAKAGFFNTAPVPKPTVTGDRNANPALASLLSGLSAEGLITDSTTTSFPAASGLTGITSSNSLTGAVTTTGKLTEKVHYSVATPAGALNQLGRRVTFEVCGRTFGASGIDGSDYTTLLWRLYCNATMTSSGSLLMPPADLLPAEPGRHSHFRLFVSTVCRSTGGAGTLSAVTHGAATGQGTPDLLPVLWVDSTPIVVDTTAPVSYELRGVWKQQTSHGEEQSTLVVDQAQLTYAN